MSNIASLSASVRFLAGAAFAALTAILLAAQPVTAASATPPAGDFDAPALLQAIDVELQLSNPTQAGQRLAALLQERAQQVLRLDDDRLQSVAQWARSWLAAHPEALAGYREAADKRASDALRKIQQNPASRHEALYAIAARYPNSSLESRLLMAAAERAMAMGDPVAARAYLDAIRDRRDARDPPDMLELSEAIDPMTRTDAGHAVAFPADWFPAEAGFFVNRSLPCAASGITFIAGAWNVLAIDAEGRITWSWSDPDAQAELHDLVTRSGRGLIHEPAVVTDIAGTSRVVVVRQLSAGDHQLALRAFAATDGRLLWNSPDIAELADVQFLGNPAACGGLIYVIGLTETQLGAHLILVCIDAASGEPVWRTTIGQVMHQPMAPARPGRREARDQAFDPQPFWQQSPPAVQGRTVVIAPGHGAVLAVDRFSGEIRWISAYTPTHTPDASKWKRYGPLGRGRPPIPVSQLIRFRSTPFVSDGIAVCAPPDSPSTFAFEMATGRLLWTVESDDAPVLIGGDEQTVVLAGRHVVGRDLRTGDQRWIHQPQEANPACGPPAVYQGVVFVPSKRTMMALSVTDGRRVDRPPEMPRIRRFVALQGIRQVLDSAGLTAAFAVQPLDSDQ